MLLIRKANSLIAIFLVFNFRLIAQDTLEYNKFITDILNNHPIVAKANNISKIGAAQYQAAKGAFDPFISSNYENKLYETKNYFSLFDAKVKQPIYSSHSISAGYQNAQGLFYNPERKTSLSGLTYFGFEVALLQGMFFDKKRSDLLKFRAQEKYLDAERKLIINEFLYNASLSFFDWLLILRKNDLLQYFTDFAKERYTAIAALANAGEYAGVDSIEARVIYQSRLIDLQSAKIEIQQKEATLMALKWVGMNQTIRPVSLYDFDFYFKKSKQLVALYFQEKEVNNPVLEKYDAYQKMLEVDVKYRTEMIKPKLDVSYNFLSNTTMDNFSSNNYKWGMQFSLPLYLRTPRNELKVSKLNAKNNLFDSKNKRNELNYQYNVFKLNIETSLNQIVNSEKNVTYSQLLLDAEKLKFEQGESSLFLLNSRESRLIEAQIKLLENKAKFIATIFKLVYLKGNLDYVL